jgi:peroxidase
VLAALFAVGVLVVALSGTDHDGRCKQPDTGPQKFRPIESHRYGTPAGAPFSRLTGGKTARTYWTNDTTPVQVTDALCEPSLDFLDPSNPEPHRRVVTLFAFFGQFVSHSFALQRGDVTQQPVFSHLARFFPGVRPSMSILDEYGAQQINTINPYLDNSANYGHTDALSASLRMLDGTGRLKMSFSPHHEGHLLPIGEDGNFTSGDVRARENFMLSALHTIFCREHNHWAHALAEQNPHWDEDRLFHTARHIVMGEMQAIIYNEWLPALVGRDRRLEQSACHDPDLRLTVRNELSTAVFRMGHTLIPNHLEARDTFAGYVVPEREVSFSDAFMQPLNASSIYLHDIDTYVLGALYQPAELFDTKITGALVLPPEMGGIFNLGGFNIARGRDHGLPSYQDAFEHVVGRPFRSIREDLTSNPKLALALEQTYDYARDPIDLWIGILSENKRAGSLMGRVGREIIIEQFVFMRNADPFFYEVDDVVEPWRSVIRATRIADIIRRNTHIEESLLQGRSFYH